MCSPSTLFFVLSQRSGPWGWVLPVPRGLCSGPPRQQKRRRVFFSPTPPKAKHTFPFSRLIKPSIFDKMGAAQVSCCVGGRVSCIGAWGTRNTSRPALYAFAVSCFIIADSGKLCKGFFVLLLTKWRGECVGGWVARHGWRLGGCRRLDARRGQMLVPLHAIPRR